MRAQITITWNTEIGDSKITFSDGFHQLDPIERVDCLQDAIGVLTDAYNKDNFFDSGKAA